MNIEVTDMRNERDDAFVASQLSAYNAPFAERDFKPLRVFAREADGSVMGGLLADTYWQYLEVHKLWVSEAHRGAGNASRLLLAAENEARRRGCKHAFLDTFSFQAPGFYLKRGYSEFGRLEAFSGKHERYYLHKRLDDTQDLTRDRRARLWKRSLPSPPEASFSSTIPAALRNIRVEDIPALGDLFHAAFLGTVDDGGLTKGQYALKATAILGGRYGAWLPEASWAIEQMGGLRSACLVSDYKPYGCPVIALVATAPPHKRAGDGGILLDAALASLTALGHRECCAMITVGNLASERLFESRKFLPF